MKQRARTFAAFFVLAGALASTVAHADDAAPRAVTAAGASAAGGSAPVTDAPDPRARYQLGTQAFQAKRYIEAAEHFEAATALRPNAVALYTAGMAWDLAGRTERAADAYARASDLGGLDAKQGGVAKERVTQLEQTLGTILVTAPEGWRVQLDGFTEVPTPARLHGAPGTHILNVRSPGSDFTQREITLEAGRVTSLDLDVQKPAAPEAKHDIVLPPTEYRESGFWNMRRTIGAAVAGGGLLALGGAVVLGLQANSAKDAFNDGPTRTSYDHASSMQTWTNVAFISGAALLAGGIVLVVLPNSTERGEVGRAQLTVVPSLGGATLGGSF